MKIDILHLRDQKSRIKVNKIILLVATQKKHLRRDKNY